MTLRLIYKDEVSINMLVRLASKEEEEEGKRRRKALPNESPRQRASEMPNRCVISLLGGQYFDATHEELSLALMMIELEGSSWLCKGFMRMILLGSL